MRSWPQDVLTGIDGVEFPNSVTTTKTADLTVGGAAFVGTGSTSVDENSTGEFDPGSERTLAARLTHASRTRKGFGPSKVADG